MSCICNHCPQLSDGQDFRAPMQHTVTVCTNDCKILQRRAVTDLKLSQWNRVVTLDVSRSDVAIRSLEAESADLATEVTRCLED